MLALVWAIISMRFHLGIFIFSLQKVISIYLYYFMNKHSLSFHQFKICYKLDIIYWSAVNSFSFFEIVKNMQSSIVNKWIVKRKKMREKEKKEREKAFCGTETVTVTIRYIDEFMSFNQQWNRYTMTVCLIIVIIISGCGMAINLTFNCPKTQHQVDRKFQRSSFSVQFHIWSWFRGDDTVRLVEKKFKQKNKMKGFTTK